MSKAAPGRIVFLNGAPNAGKTTLALAVQAMSERSISTLQVLWAIFNLGRSTPPPMWRGAPETGRLYAESSSERGLTVCRVGRG